MNKQFNNRFLNKKAVTLMEIMLAVVILAFTFLPIISTIGTSMKDTDTTHSYVFAQTVARNILDYVLDELPFNSLTSANDYVGIIQNSKGYNIEEGAEVEYNDDKLKKFRELIGSGDDNNTVGVLKDERGNSYNIILYVFPIKANKTVATSTSEMLFSYYDRPKYESNWFKIPSDDKDKTKFAYLENDNDFLKFAEDKVLVKRIKNACDIGAKNNTETGTGYCVMKKIVLHISWDANGKRSGKIHRDLVFYTMKANLDSEK